jgi:hypothetical protein
MTILVTIGQKEDMWLPPSSEKCKGALHTAPNLGEYGLTYARFCRLMRAFALPPNGDNTDPFDHVRQVVDLWSRRIANQLSPGPLLTMDESNVVGVTSIVLQ